MSITNNKIKIIITLIICVAVALSVMAIITTVQPDPKLESEPATNLTLQPVKVGERYTDIPATDTKKQKDFIYAGAATYNLNPNESTTPQSIAMACAQTETAKITQTARAVEAYRDNYAQIKADVQKAKEICYERYADTPYVAPAKPQGHIDPETFLPIEH